MTPWQPSSESTAPGLRAAVRPGPGPNSPGHAFRGERSGERIYAERDFPARCARRIVSSVPLKGVKTIAH